MWDVGRMINNKNTFIGIVSSNYQDEGRNLLKEHMESYFSNGGGIIYICSREKEECIDHLQEICEFDLNHYIKKSRIIFICGENFKVKDNMDLDRLINGIKNGINLLDKRGSNKKLVYITVDSSWNSLENNKIEYIYETFKTINKEEESGFVLKYIIDEINGNYINHMLNNHDIILIDRTDNFEYFTPDQLMHESLILLAEYHAADNRYEKEIVRSEYLKTLGELMEGTVHDINNLLVTILGYAQLSLFLEDPEEVKKCLETISKTALDGKSITDRIKNHVRGSYNSLKDVYHFDYIINNSLEMVKHKFRLSNGNSNKMELVVDLNSNSYIYANEYDIRHSIINIILNGIDAMENKGTLTVKTYDEEDHIVLEISDTGKGMDEGTMNKIFRPYFTTKGSQGTGLGLSIAKKTFEKHNGKVYVESKVGKGTKFVIYLPALRVKDNIAHI